MDLDHVQVAAPPGGEDDARRFYGELLGLEEVAKPDSLADRGGVWFSVGGKQLHVGIDEGFVASTKAHPAFRVADRAELEAVAKRLEDGGHLQEWDSSLPDVDRFYVNDPFGNRLEVLAYN